MEREKIELIKFQFTSIKEIYPFADDITWGYKPIDVQYLIESFEKTLTERNIPFTRVELIKGSYILTIPPEKEQFFLMTLEEAQEYQGELTKLR